MRNPIPLLRRVAQAEAVSFLVLLGVAMPLKYAFGMPEAVQAVGWIHGLLFVLFCAVLLQTTLVARWPLGRAALVFGSSLIPFGPFLIDRRLLGYAAELGSAATT